MSGSAGLSAEDLELMALYGAAPGAAEAVAKVLLKVRGMSAGEKQAVLRDRQGGRAAPGSA